MRRPPVYLRLVRMSANDTFLSLAFQENSNDILEAKKVIRRQGASPGAPQTPNVRRGRYGAGTTFGTMR